MCYKYNDNLVKQPVSRVMLSCRTVYCLLFSVDICWKYAIKKIQSEINKAAYLESFKLVFKRTLYNDFEINVKKSIA